MMKNYECKARQIPFFLENALKKLFVLNIFSNFFFYLKVQSFRLITENNFIQINASASHAEAYTIGPIFKRIIEAYTQTKSISSVISSQQISGKNSESK